MNIIYILFLDLKSFNKNLTSLVLATCTCSCKYVMEASLLGLANHNNIYLLLAEFSVRSVNYGPSFFESIYGPSARRAGHKLMEKNEDP